METMVLASGSPRRRGFLRLMGLAFACKPAGIDEAPEPGLGPREVAEALALRKAEAVAARLGPGGARWILGADTVVALGGEIIGKPGSEGEAGRALRRLSGRRHEVVTAVALLDARSGRADRRWAGCEVEFAELSEGDVEWYVGTGEWRGPRAGTACRKGGPASSPR